MEAVSEVMARDLVRIAPDVTLTDAARAMAARRVGSALVFEGDRLVGIVTERDILRAVAEGRLGETAGEAMTPQPETIAASDPIEHAGVLMLHGGFRHLPVTEGGEVVGVVSIRDLVGHALQDAAPRGV
ncbi:MAG TPA: CBS domain-containing protein [Gaiellaceae bacterium]|nr:CBS domain-containing protein [Gaiellaceae bacterium]